MYAHTIATLRSRITIYNSSVLRKLAHQGGNQRYFARLPASFGEHSSTVGTDVFRYGVFASPRLFQVREVDLNWQRLAPLNSRIETLQTRNLPLRTVIISLLVLDGLDSFWRFHGLPPALVLKETRGDTAWEPKLPLTGMAQGLCLAAFNSKEYRKQLSLIAGADKLGKHWSCDAGNPLSRLRCLARWDLKLE